MYTYKRTVRHHLCRGRRLMLGIAVFIIAGFVTMDALFGPFFGTNRSYLNTITTSTNKTVDQLLSKDSLQQPTPILTSENTQLVTRQNMLNVSATKSVTLQNLATKLSHVNKTVTKPVENISLQDIAKCLPQHDTSNIKTPFKIFVYNLPSRFNFDIQRTMTDGKKFSFCYNLDYCGTGKELLQLGVNNTEPGTSASSLQVHSVRDTHQFSLEPIIHYKMLNSPYRTLDPNKADMFYIPAYTGLNCLMFTGTSKEFIADLFNHLKTNESHMFNSGKPHVFTLSKIQREQGSSNCPTLMHPETENITFIGIEKEANPFWSTSQLIHGKSLIVVPYPSYVHFIPQVGDNTLNEFEKGLRNLTDSKFYLDVPSLKHREVLLFLAAGTRRSNYFRARLLDQFHLQTSKSYEELLQEMTRKGKDIPNQIMLITSECSSAHRTTTIPWMRHSVYCLQPPGDSPTRKSIYDSILSGCIPILISSKFKTEYPFEKYLDYSKFTYTIDENLFQRYNKTVFEIVSGISSDKTKMLHRNLCKVAKWFQYSLPNSRINTTDDAFTLILDELAKQHHTY